MIRRDRFADLEHTALVWSNAGMRALAVVLLIGAGCPTTAETSGSATASDVSSSGEVASSTAASSDPADDCEPTTPGVFAAVFAAHCNTPGCHAGNQPAVGLDLSSAQTLEARLVGIASACDGAPLVVPGDAVASLLFQKLTDAQSCGDAMPIGAPLDTALVECVEAWIGGLSSVCEQCGGATCVDIAADPAHCGGCDSSCPRGVACVDGECACPSAASLCAGECVDTASNPAHCGGCDQQCDMFCLEGECAADCGALTACSGACVDTQSATLHCGGCDAPCEPGMACVDGSCSCAAAVVSFAATIEPLLDAECSAMGCHGSPVAQEGLDLRAGHSYADLVGVESDQCDGRLLVAPGEPGSSYLVDKLRGVDLCSGTQMPKAGQSLAEEDIVAIEAWICHGAPEN